MKIIKNQFVAVALNLSFANVRKDADGAFLRTIGGPFRGTGCWLCVTADGKKLGGDLRQALQRWDKLPASERKPGAIRLGERGPIDTTTEPQPPPGGLILKLYFRHLARRPDGSLRRAESKDFTGREVWLQQAQPGVCWLTEKTWKSLVPSNPVEGDRYSVPGAVREHLVRRYLHPLSTFSGCQGWRRQEVRSAELALVIEEVTPARVRLRLEGAARLGAEYDPDLASKIAKAPHGQEVGLGYEPTLQGYLEYDRKRQAFTRFDLAAIGDCYGLTSGNSRSVYRPGRQPLGVAFELSKGDKPADRISN